MKTGNKWYISKEQTIIWMIVLMFIGAITPPIFSFCKLKIKEAIDNRIFSALNEQLLLSQKNSTYKVSDYNDYDTPYRIHTPNFIDGYVQLLRKNERLELKLLELETQIDKLTNETKLSNKGNK